MKKSFTLSDFGKGNLIKGEIFMDLLTTRTFNGVALDCYHRLQICEELGIKDYPKVIRVGMTEAEKLTHARKLNLARRHLTTTQKQELIKAQLKETPEKSDRQIAKDLGVDNHTVAAQREKLEITEEIPHLDKTVGADGKIRRKPISVFNPTKREEKVMKKRVNTFWKA